jgi:two-component system OmpR family response regulator/two-component system response regulator QseB
MRILLVEDNLALAQGINTALVREGHAVDHATTAAGAEHFLAAESFDVMILDLGLPDEDGLMLLNRIRRRGAILPVLILTARDTLDDIVRGLDLGGDDYLTKPFEQQELFARLRVLERRNTASKSSMLELGPLRLDLGSHQLFIDDELVVLPRREFALLRVLAEQPGRVYSREELEQKLYSMDGALSSNAIEVHIHNLRKKLPQQVIRNVRGVGYYLGLDA